MTIESFKLIFACYDEDKYFEIFKEVLYVVRSVNQKSKLKRVQKLFDIPMNIRYMYNRIMAATIRESLKAKNI